MKPSHINKTQDVVVYHGNSQRPKIFKDHPEALKELGSWLGIPLKQDDHTFGMLVVGVKRQYYLTELRVRMLEDTAARLLPMFLWGLAQYQRDWLRRALAHEYREPVNRLYQLVEYLPMEQERLQAKALLRYQASIISNLNLLGEEGIKKATTIPDSVDLFKVLKEVTDTLHALYSNKEFTGVDQQPCYVKTSEEALYQILFNLLENACKFSLERHPIRISTAREGSMLRVEIWNRAFVPIPQRDRKRIFQPYQRGSEAPSAKGAGIGLAVVRRLCNALGMTCELSHPGTQENPEICFQLLMPIAESEKPERKELSDAQALLRR
jgi:signal transduction histidine kinase